MFWEEDPESGYHRVWLSQEEVELLLDHTDDRIHQLAFELGVRCGLRSKEILQVAPAHIRDTAAGDMLVVDSAKNDSTRQPPIPSDLATRIKTIGDVRDEDPEEPVIDASTRTLRRWISAVCEDIADDDDEYDMWSEVSMHDLRRTWATALKGEDVDAMVVCDWGGWNDLETFLEHYRGKFSPEAQRKQRDKVEWL
jgi:integrase